MSYAFDTMLHITHIYLLCSNGCRGYSQYHVIVVTLRILGSCHTITAESKVPHFTVNHCFSHPPSLPPLPKPHHSSRLLLPLPLRSAMPFVRAASRARPLCLLRAPARRVTPVLSSRPAFSTTARRCSDDPHAEETFEEFSAR